MTARANERSFNRMTWGEFIDLLEPHGITLAVLPVQITSSRALKVPGYHLVRRHPPPPAAYPLTLAFRTDDVVGALVIYAVCRRFGIEPHFPGWGLIL